MSEEYQQLSVMVEAQIAFPAVVLVAGLTEQDGANRVARGLAQAFFESGRRSILVRAGETASETFSGPGDGEGEGEATVSLPPTRNACAKLEVLRGEADIIVVSTSALLSKTIGLELARFADGVLIAVRLGRAITRADEHVPAVLARLGATLLGAVTTQSGVDPIRRSTKSLPAHARASATGP